MASWILKILSGLFLVSILMSLYRLNFDLWSLLMFCVALQTLWAILFFTEMYVIQYVQELEKQQGEKISVPALTQLPSAACPEKERCMSYHLLWPHKKETHNRHGRRAWGLLMVICWEGSQLSGPRASFCLCWSCSGTNWPQDKPFLSKGSQSVPG